MIPLLNSSSSYVFLPPFNTTNQNIIYTCKAIGSIKECLANNQNPYETIYLKNGLTQEDYERDLNNDELIISFQTTQDRWIFIPSRYISSSNPNGVPYHRVMIGVNLGSLPVDFNLGDLFTDITGVVVDNIGVQPILKKVILSPQALVPNDDHEAVDLIRRGRASAEPSNILKCARLEALLVEHRNKITELEGYILRNFTNLPEE